MGERTLTSWKEIAHHLGVNVRTVQRWERERGLPITRLPGGSGRASTTTSALEEWQKAAKRDTAKSRTDVVCYRWPLDPQVTCEVKISGGTITIEHISRLKEYLRLVETALQG